MGEPALLFEAGAALVAETMLHGAAHGPTS
jgi:hypothetical protein